MAVNNASALQNVVHATPIIAEAVSKLLDCLLLIDKRWLGSNQQHSVLQKAMMLVWAGSRRLFTCCNTKDFAIAKGASICIFGCPQSQWRQFPVNACTLTNRSTPIPMKHQPCSHGSDTDRWASLGEFMTKNSAKPRDTNEEYTRTSVRLATNFY